MTLPRSNPRLRYNVVMVNLCVGVRQNISYYTVCQVDFVAKGHHLPPFIRLKLTWGAVTAL